MERGPSTILFIHGWATDSAVWEEQAKRFGSTFDILNIDLPGHGGEGRWDEPTLDAAVGEAELYLKGRADRSVVGIGWSLGAQVMIEAAARRSAPFSSLVLVGATPCFVKRDDFPWGQPRALARRMILDMKKDPAGTLRRFYALNFTEEESGAEGVIGFIRRYAPEGRAAGGPGLKYPEVTTALEALYSADIRGGLARVEVPALVIHGDEDGVCPAGAGRRLASDIRHAELKVFNGAGHAPFITRPAEFHEAVKDFLSRI